MTVKLELNTEVEANLLAQAQARGLSLEAYLDQVLRKTAVFPTQEEAIARAPELHPELGADCAMSRPKGKKSLATLFAESPFRGLDLPFGRDPDIGRPDAL